MPVREARILEAHRQSTEATLQDVVRFLDETLGRALTAHIAAVDPRTVARWIGGDAVRSADTERRLRLAYNIFVLLQKKDSPHTVRAWFIGLNPQLDDMSPAEALHQGKERKVLTAAKSFALGG